MKKLLLLVGVILFSCEDDFEIPDNHYEVQTYLRQSCSSQELIEQKGVKILFYSTERLYDFSDKTFLKEIEYNKGVYHSQLEEGNYYFEVYDKKLNKLLEGVYKIPDDLSDDNKIVLAKGTKKGFVRYKNWDGYNIGYAEIIFTNEITKEQFVFNSNNKGNVCVELNPGRYHFRVNHPDYESYDSKNGFSVFHSMYNDGGNYFLEKKED